MFVTTDKQKVFTDCDCYDHAIKRVGVMHWQIKHSHGMAGRKGKNSHLQVSYQLAYGITCHHEPFHAHLYGDLRETDCAH